MIPFVLPSPIGSIVSWVGSIVNIPSGWQLCDGTNGTPDLRNKFIPGSGDTYAVHATGGAVNHDHDFTGDGHTHSFGAGASIQSGMGIHHITDNVPASGTTDAKNGLPAYYALAYIQFLGV